MGGNERIKSCNKRMYIKTMGARENGKRTEEMTFLFQL